MTPRRRSLGSRKATSALFRDDCATRHEAASWRKHLTASQQPFATILACSDSRVPPELVFDQGFGDLFVIRVAGNIIATDVLGSLQYATLHLHTPLVVVMGHESCGAVTAAVDALEGRGTEPRFIAALVAAIEPGLKGPSRLAQGRRPRTRGRPRPTCAGRCASSRPFAEVNWP